MYNIIVEKFYSETSKKDILRLEYPTLPTSRVLSDIEDRHSSLELSQEAVVVNVFKVAEET